MISPDTLIQLKAFARQDGMLLALFWTASFAMTMMAPQSIWGNVLAMATPFFMGWRTTLFRDGALDGVISFRRAAAHGIYSVFYASLVFALVQYVYFRFLDNGTFLGIMSDGVKVIEDLYKQQGLNTSEITQSLETMRSISPVQWAFMLMLQNITIGSLLALPVAAISAMRLASSGCAESVLNKRVSSVLPVSSVLSDTDDAEWPASLAI